MSMMTSFKRKRIEKWCQDVAQYLQDGTICKSVIGNVAEDAICGNGISGPIRFSHGNNSNNNINENILENFALINKNSSQNAGLNISSKNLNAKVDLAFKKAAQTLNSPDNNNNVSNVLGVSNNSNNNNGGGVGNANGSINIGGSFPVVKFAYSHYHEQRRKIDRLVQGLPVLNANGVTSADRPSSKCSTTEDHNVPIIIVNGEEPVRSSHTRSRSSSQPRRDGTPNLHKRNGGGGGGGSGGGGGGPTPLSSANYLHHIQAPNSGRRNVDTSPRRQNPLHQSSSGTTGYDSRHQLSSANTNNINNHNNTTNMSMEQGVNMSANDRISRIKTAPAPNRNLHRARQRILSRRGNRVLEHTSQIPLQNCWALAELTW